MRITAFEVFYFQLPLQKELKIHGQVISRREGLIIELKNAEGATGCGEISPLPGLSRESLSSAKQQILKLQKFLIDQEISNHFEQLNGKFEQWLGPYKLAPSVRYGLEMAVLNLIANTKHLNLQQLISQFKHDRVPVCALVSSLPKDIPQEVEKLVEQGFRTLKLKVGQHSIEEDIQTVQKINAIIENKALLRLDANQQWNVNKAVTFGNEIGCAAVEYIEEPFADKTQFDEFFMKTTIPIALDESLQEVEFKEVKSFSSVDVLVLKPLVLGGIERTWSWMKQAKQFGLATVISSSFETGLGITALANLAGGSHVVHPAGLDTLKWFKDDVLKDKIPMEKGNILLGKPIVSRDQLNTNLLQAVS